jgi:hypothetical protein
MFKTKRGNYIIMNLKQYIDADCNELQLPEELSHFDVQQIASEIGDKVCQIEVPNMMKVIPRPDAEMIYESMWTHPVLARAWTRKMEFIRTQPLTALKRRMKIQIAKNKLIDMYSLSYITNRDNLIYKNNQALKALNLYKHDKTTLTRDELIEIYQSQQGYRRFPTQAAYNYYINTGKCPYNIK